MELQTYNNQFVGGAVIVTNNNTLIPWGFLAHTPQYAVGNSLLFVQQASANMYG